MNTIIRLLARKRGLRIRFLILFLVLVYIPISINIFIVYNRTIDVIKQEKTEDIEQIMRKASETFSLTLANIQEKTQEVTNHKAFRKGIQDYPEYTDSVKEKLLKYYQEELAGLESSPYIDQVLCVTERGELFYFGEDPLIDPDKFLDSPFYQSFVQKSDKEMWLYGTFKGITAEDSETPLFFVIQKLKAVGVENKKTIDLDENVGYAFTFLNIEGLKDLFSSVTIEASGKIGFYDEHYTPVLGTPTQQISQDILKPFVEEERFYQSKEVVLEKEPHIMEVIPIPILNWFVTSGVAVDQMVGSTRNALRQSFWLIAMISAVVALWILLEIFVLSKLLTEKEMANYRLLVSEETNQKLKIYKHDFLNHLQVIQGLLQLEHADKALNYIRTVSSEGRKISPSYDIGIPELESAVFAYLASAEEKGIQVRLETITLPEDLSIQLYDLIKIVTNLIKNAVYALEHAEGDSKVLSVQIYEEGEDYTIEISNNIPLIPQELQDRIFTKGFTTKGHEGSGLGLHIVQKLAEKNGCRVELIVDEEGNHFMVSFSKK